MTKYCPTCENEYQDDFSACPDDNETLLDAPSIQLNRGESIDIYAAASDLEAKRIVVILNDAGIAAQIFRQQVSQLPWLGDTHFVVAVPKSKKESASKHINNARIDSVISDTGLFL